MQKTLFNGYSDNCCAYCKYHMCGMTFKQIRVKDCLNKQCHYLIRKGTHPVWQQRARTKALRRQRRPFGIMIPGNPISWSFSGTPMMIEVAIWQQ